MYMDYNFYRYLYISWCSAQMHEYYYFNDGYIQHLTDGEVLVLKIKKEDKDVLIIIMVK